MHAPDPTSLLGHNDHDPMASATHGPVAYDLSQALTVAHIANGMDPLSAVLQAQLDTPLLQPFLG